MSAWTPALREKAYILCRDRDGNECKRCKRVPVKEIKDPLREVYHLTVDHIDDNPKNNPVGGSNWQLLCQGCNNRKRKMPAKKTKSVDKFADYKSYRALRERKRGREIGGVYSPEMAKNDEAEPEFRRYVEEVLTAVGEVKKSDLLDAGANNNLKIFGWDISQQALARYLSKWINPINGDFEEINLNDTRYVRIKNRKRTGE